MHGTISGVMHGTCINSAIFFKAVYLDRIGMHCIITYDILALNMIFFNVILKTEIVASTNVHQGFLHDARHIDNGARSNSKTMWLLGQFLVFQTHLYSVQAFKSSYILIEHAILVYTIFGLT